MSNSNKRYRAIPVQLNENIFKTDQEISNEIQILRVGNFIHDGQRIEIKKSDLKNMVNNFKKDVRKNNIMLDFSHQSHLKAAAWFEELYLDETGKELWAKVSWNEIGASAVREKEYLYTSADFTFNYKDNETGKEHGTTLLGCALTNRPAVRGMAPTILLEENLTKEKNMELEELKKAFASLQEENKKLKGKLAEKDGSDKDKEKNFAEREASIKLAEEKLINDKKLAEKKDRFDTMLSEGKTVEAQRDAFMADDMDKFIDNAYKGDLNLSEKGHGSNNSNKGFVGSDTPAQDEVISLAEKKMKSDDIDIASAIEIILSENSNLNEKYQKEVEV